MASNGQGTRVISSGRQQRVAPIDPAAGAAPTVQGEAVSIGPGVEADPVIWTARLRTGRVVIFLASGSRAFRAAASIAAAVVEDSAVIASVAAEDLGAVALAALAGSAVAGSGDVGSN